MSRVDNEKHEDIIITFARITPLSRSMPKLTLPSVSKLALHFSADERRRVPPLAQLHDQRRRAALRPVATRLLPGAVRAPYRHRFNALTKRGENDASTRLHDPKAKARVGSGAEARVGSAATSGRPRQWPRSSASAGAVQGRTVVERRTSHVAQLNGDFDDADAEESASDDADTDESDDDESDDEDEDCNRYYRLVDVLLPVISEARLSTASRTADDSTSRTSEEEHDNRSTPTSFQQLPDLNPNAAAGIKRTVVDRRELVLAAENKLRSISSTSTLHNDICTQPVSSCESLADGRTRCSVALTPHMSRRFVATDRLIDTNSYNMFARKSRRRNKSRRNSKSHSRPSRSILTPKHAFACKKQDKLTPLSLK